MKRAPCQPTVSRQKVHQLLAAIDRALVAARAVEKARDAILREAQRLRELRLVGEEQPAS